MLVGPARNIAPHKQELAGVGGGAGESSVVSREVIPVWGLRGLVMTWHGIGLGGCLPGPPSTTTCSPDHKQGS